jgi:excisionase family DNA binding protein
VSNRLDRLFSKYPEQLDVDQLAEILGVARLTAYRYLQKGEVPGYKVGRSWLILRDEVRDHLTTRRNVPSEYDKDRSGTDRLEE